MEYRSGKRPVDVRSLKHFVKMLNRSRTAGGNQRNVANGPHRFELLEIVAFTDTILVHAVQYDLARSASLNLFQPSRRLPPRFLRAFFVAGKLMHLVLAAAVIEVAVNADDNALLTNPVVEARNEFRVP